MLKIELIVSWLSLLQMAAVFDAYRTIVGHCSAF